MSQLKPLRAVIVDDEDHCIKTLKWELQACTPACEVVASFTDSTEALGQLPTLEPDILFLDIEMPQLNGFELVRRLNEHKALRAHLIFTTAYSDYAVKAFKFSAVEYLLKPVDREELEGALQKVAAATQATNEQDAASLRLLFDNLDALDRGRPMRLSLPSTAGYELVHVRDIIRLSSDGSYTNVYLQDGRCITVSRHLKQLEESLPEQIFVRVHHSHLVNFEHVKRYLRQDGGTLVMSDGGEVAVARSRKDHVLSLIR